MENQTNVSKQPSHSGGDIRFWQDERVRRYDYQQSLISEKKQEVQANITRILAYFCKIHSIVEPKILDIGCGPGTPLTLSRYILDKLPGSVVLGVDSSDQMIKAANKNLVPRYGGQFSGYVNDFNSDGFWTAEIDRNYNFIVSSGALHYLSDQRRRPFLKEVFGHLEDNGILVACIGNRSMVPEITEMEHIFRIEFTYGQFGEGRRPKDFQEFRKKFEETDKKANINWQSYRVWLDAMRGAGFKGVDIVWHLWVRSIFVAIK